MNEESAVLMTPFIRSTVTLPAVTHLAVELPNDLASLVSMTQSRQRGSPLSGCHGNLQVTILVTHTYGTGC